MQYRQAPAVATAVDMLLNHRDLTLQDAEVVEAALEQYRGKPAVSFSDCLVLEVLERRVIFRWAPLTGTWRKLDGAQRL